MNLFNLGCGTGVLHHVDCYQRPSGVAPHYSLEDTMEWFNATLCPKKFFGCDDGNTDDTDSDLEDVIDAIEAAIKTSIAI